VLALLATLTDCGDELWLLLHDDALGATPPCADWFEEEKLKDREGAPINGSSPSSPSATVEMPPQQLGAPHPRDPAAAVLVAAPDERADPTAPPLPLAVMGAECMLATACCSMAAAGVKLMLNFAAAELPMFVVGRLFARLCCSAVWNAWRPARKNRPLMATIEDGGRGGRA